MQADACAGPVESFVSSSGYLFYRSGDEGGEMIDVDKIPPPAGAKRGHWNTDGVAPVWVEDGPDWWLWLKRASVVVGLIVGTLTAITLTLNLL